MVGGETESGYEFIPLSDMVLEKAQHSENGSICPMKRSELICPFLTFFFFSAVLHGSWALSSPSRDQTRALCSGPPEKSLLTFFF